MRKTLTAEETIARLNGLGRTVHVEGGNGEDATLWPIRCLSPSLDPQPDETPAPGL